MFSRNNSQISPVETVLLSVLHHSDQNHPIFYQIPISNLINSPPTSTSNLLYSDRSCRGIWRLGTDDLVKMLC